MCSQCTHTLPRVQSAAHSEERRLVVLDRSSSRLAVAVLAGKTRVRRHGRGERLRLHPEVIPFRDIELDAISHLSWGSDSPNFQALLRHGGSTGSRLHADDVTWRCFSVAYRAAGELDDGEVAAAGRDALRSFLAGAGVLPRAAATDDAGHHVDRAKRAIGLKFLEYPRGRFDYGKHKRATVRLEEVAASIGAT